MRLTTAVSHGVAVFRIEGKMMGGPDSARAHDEVTRAIEEGVRNFLIDLGRVPHMNSGGVGCLVSCLHTVRNAGGSMKILKPARRINEILRITDLIRIFECFNDEDEALASFNHA